MGPTETSQNNMEKILEANMELQMKNSNSNEFGGDYLEEEDELQVYSWCDSVELELVAKESDCYVTKT